MPKPKKAKVVPIQKKETAEEEARALIPLPPPRSPKHKPPAPAAKPSSPGKKALGEAKAGTAFWRKAVKLMDRKMKKVLATFEHAGTRFDGQMVRLTRELGKAHGVEAWSVERKLHKAEISYREARLAVELETQKSLTAKLGLQEAICAQKDVTIARLQKHIRMHRAR